MAAVVELGNGRRAVQFQRPGTTGSAKRERDTIYLGKVSKADAKIVGGHIDHLLSATVTRRAVPWETSQWLATVGPKLHAKLFKHGLVAPREEEMAVPLKPFLQDFIDKRPRLKPRTRINLEQAMKKLAEYFKPDRDLRTITRGEAKDWERHLKAELARATASTHIKKAKQFFQDAVDRKLIKESPFAGMKAGKQTNEARMYYVPVADVLRVIEKCPDAEWKLLFAMARFAGLRVPSEIQPMEWSHIRWDEGRFTVISPKTEHHEGRGTRQVPLFPELRPFLEAAKAAAGPGARYVFRRLRGENLRTTADRTVRAAGLAVWPKLFQNMRSSCQTDLTTKYPQHVACAWVGNTEVVARKHYLQVTDDHFSSAAGRAPESAAKSAAGNTGQETPELSKSSQNEHFSSQTSPAEYPQGESKERRNARENQAPPKNALPDSLPNALPAEQVDKIKVAHALARMNAGLRGSAGGGVPRG